MVRPRSAVVPPEVSATLRLARKEREMSMDRAAKTARISTSLWTQVENGTQYKRGQKVAASTTAETLQAMAEAVGLDATPLLTQAGLEPVPVEHPRPQHQDGIVDLSGLSEGDLRIVAAYVNGLRAARHS
ncbi:helix-turn-helix domain-containing protein [Nocardia mangyaensis]|uniref:helix-turn-helix domain-containing protein n=1 Tax=Nocardia mangyaensis TaxID=2213200 RepID=UPI0014303434|nr:helix-turn-helix transcriptional regulator [Nocardia mangyaensis]MDO3649350.1 helix-turn-helix transcriptional regulator [Nocardia mangyaensis]